MKLICSFYIGHQGYLLENPSIPENESHEERTNQISEVVFRNIGQEEFKVYVSNSSTELSAALKFKGKDLLAVGFSTETAIADDEKGQPVLFYVNAHFEVPDDFNEEGDVDAQLNVGNYSLVFEGLAEVEEDE